MMNRHLAIAIATVALVGAACGGAATATPTAAPTAAPTGSPTAARTAGPAVVPTAAPPTPAPTAAATSAPTSVPTAAATDSSILPAAAHRPQTIHLILNAINDTVGSLNGCSDAGTCRGDYMIGDDPLFDAATGKQVGTFAYECFLVDVATTLYHCPGVTITLDGRGQIVFTEVIQHRSGMPPALSPITGGTGEFLGATGDVTARVVSSGGDFVITITK